MTTLRKPLRLWPGVAAVALQWLVRFGVPFFVSDSMNIGVIGGIIGGLAVIIWWAFFSRAPWPDRLSGTVLMVVALIATPLILHKSIATGMMGMMFAISCIPFLSLAFVVWAAASRGLSNGPRRASMVATILLSCGVWALLRTDGITGEGAAQLAWRWSETHEARLLSRAVAPTAAKVPEQLQVAAARMELPVLPKPETVAETEKVADWPGFRGRGRDGVVRGTRIGTDWSTSPPIELWRRPIGPGWSSFAVQGDLLYTQEQRGDDEVVACYRVGNGQPVWTHKDAARFWESNAGAGPRGTPTLSNGRVYTFGATGILNSLNAADGSVVWSRNAASDTDTKIPGWGFSSSPVVVGRVVIVAIAGKLAAYDLGSGNPRWAGPAGGGGYSSPHLVTIDGVAQVMLLNGAGAIGMLPTEGRVLWEYKWPGSTIVQPAMASDGDLLISTSDMAGGVGIRRIKVSRKSSGWTANERWTSVGLKPYFNDFVVHKGHAFGFDGRILACIGLEDGKRKWKGGRYGNGQLVLLADQDLLLVLSEEGELALVKATTDEFTEVARFPAIEGKTWNHPAMVGDVLLVRNGQEMAAFRLPHPN